MKFSKNPMIMAVVLATIVIAGCGQRSKTDDVAQNGQQSTASQSTAPQTGNDTNSSGSTTTAVVVDDSVITTKVKAALVAEPTLSALDIKVKTNDGVVTLSGTIDTVEKSERAKQLAQTIDGVKTINNELVVKSST